MAKRQLITLATMWLALVGYSAMQGQCHEVRTAERTGAAPSSAIGPLACKVVEPWR